METELHIGNSELILIVSLQLRSYLFINCNEWLMGPSRFLQLDRPVS
jgi:hypothetical protein